MDNLNLEKVIQLRRELHMHPCLSNNEMWTKKRIYQFLEENTKLELHDRGLWMYAVYRSGSDRPGLAFRADYDALPIMEARDCVPWASQIPGISHKCGHDGHAATLCALAMEVERQGAPRDVFFLFQHAEETGDGARVCCDMLRENNIGEIYAYHNVPDYAPNEISLRDGTNNCASKGMSIYMTGAPAHASTPEDGRNPAFAIASLVSKIPLLLSSDKWTGMVLCTVIQIDVGEEAFGTAAGKGVLRLTLRALHMEEMEQLQKQLEEFAAEKAEEYGLELKFTFHDEFPDTVNHKICMDKVRTACNELGLKIHEMPEAKRGSEDFGWYTKLIPGAYFHVGNGGAPLHTAEYDFNDSIMETPLSIFMKLIQM